MDSELTNKKTLTIAIWDITAKLLGIWRRRRPWSGTGGGWRFRVDHHLQINTHIICVLPRQQWGSLLKFYYLILLATWPRICDFCISFNSQCLNMLSYCYNQLIRVHYIARCATLIYSSLCLMRHVRIFSLTSQFWNLDVTFLTAHSELV